MASQINEAGNVEDQTDLSVSHNRPSGDAFDFSKALQRFDYHLLLAEEVIDLKAAFSAAFADDYEQGFGGILNRSGHREQFMKPDQRMQLAPNHDDLRAILDGGYLFGTRPQTLDHGMDGDDVSLVSEGHDLAVNNRQRKGKMNQKRGALIGG